MRLRKPAHDFIGTLPLFCQLILRQFARRRFDRLRGAPLGQFSTTAAVDQITNIARLWLAVAVLPAEIITAPGPDFVRREVLQRDHPVGKDFGLDQIGRAVLPVSVQESLNTKADPSAVVSAFLRR